MRAQPDAVEGRGEAIGIPMDAVAARISATAALQGFERACAMGAVILEGFCRGDERLWSSRAKGKRSSIRTLASRLGGVARATELHRSVHVFLLCRRLPFVAESPHLTVGHVDAVLGLAPGEQEELLRTAALEGLSVRDLRARRRRLRTSGTGDASVIPEATVQAHRALYALRCAHRALVAAEASGPPSAELVAVLEGVAGLARDLVTLASGDTAARPVKKTKSAAIQAAKAS